jgi:hypothetical protein
MCGDPLLLNHKFGQVLPIRIYYITEYHLQQWRELWFGHADMAYLFDK